MKNRILITFILISLFSFYSRVSASESCSSNGYSIFTINGIFTNEDGAINNKKNLKKLLTPTYNSEPLTIDYLYNPTHLAGVGDVVDAIEQGVFDQKSDYDLIEILNDASKKVTTQKLLLVAHSQGNFYANSFYDKIVSQPGGVPTQSTGVYSVATPSNRVAGGGKYLTSDTDNVIASTVARFIDILPPNIHIPLQGSDGNGHSFSDVYLKYQGDRIVADIKSFLDKLKENDEQNAQGSCISAPKLSAIHKIQGAILAVADPTANVVKGGMVGAYNGGVYIADVARNTGTAIGNLIRNTGITIGKTAKDLLANALGSLGDPSSVTTLSAGAGESTSTNISAENAEAIPPSILPSKQKQQEEKIITKETTNIIESTTNANAEAIPSRETEITQTISSVPSVPNFIFRGGGGSTRGSVSTVISEPKVEPLPKEEFPKESPLEKKDPSPLIPDPIPDPDTTKPIITLAGDNPVNIIKGTTYTDAGATAIDETDGVRTITTTGSINTTTVGAYTITYTATDLSSNVSTSTRTINVIAPPPPPLATFTIDKDTTLPIGEYNYDNLIITNNATLTLEGNPLSSNSFKGVKINAVNITIDNGSRISADGQGYSSGPGTSLSDEGGSGYGGKGGGGNTAKPVYGSAIKPIDLGSGKEGYARGGGAIHLVVSNNFINNGVISAEGSRERSSGGSIYVTTNNLSGTGKFSANGANTSWPYQNSGGGGRIAIYYKDFSFSGEATASAGLYCFYGCNPAAEPGTVGFFNLSDNSLNVFSTWNFQKNDEPFNFSKIILKKNAKSKAEDGVIINADSLLVDGSSSFFLLGNQIFNIPNITIDGGGTLTFSGKETINTDTLLVTGGSTLTLSGSEKIIANLLAIKGNSTVTVIPEKILSLTTIPNITIDAGSSISTDEKGYITGPGTPLDPNFSAGASYGGVGIQNTPTSIYGSAAKPVDFGNGGRAPHPKGGGVIRLIVTDTLTNNGLISASGNVSSSGGSVYITAKSITGSGTFSANGGNLYAGGYFAGPGGGGRVALYYETLSFTGKAEALGGCGSYDGFSKTCAKDGTVGFFDTINNNLLADTSWQFRKNDSPFNFKQIIFTGAQIAIEDGVEITANDILLDKVSTLTLSGSETINADALVLAGNSTITVLPEKILSLKIPNITINSGSSISADAKGYITGPGTPDAGILAGASYGGKGGGALAKAVYGLVLEPVDFGSGTEGRRAGGAIRLIAVNSLINNGLITVNGNGERVSGGSIYVTANTISGNGVFQAVGGNSSWPYGPIAGGGGRIVIYYKNSSFSGTTNALGGVYCFSGCVSAAEEGTVLMVDESIPPL